MDIEVELEDDPKGPDTAEKRIVIYGQGVFQRMFDKLKECGFERIDMDTWVYAYPHGNRWIKVTVSSQSYVTVNFNDENTCYMSPFGVLEGMTIFGGG